MFYPLVKALTMTTGADVRDILELTGGDNESGPISKKDIINSDKVPFPNNNQKPTVEFSQCIF